MLKLIVLHKKIYHKCPIPLKKVMARNDLQFHFNVIFIRPGYRFSIYTSKHAYSLTVGNSNITPKGNIL